MNQGSPEIETGHTVERIRKSAERILSISALAPIIQAGHAALWECTAVVHQAEAA